MALAAMTRGARRRHARRNARGVTLVELVVVLTIMGVIGSLAATLVGRVASAQQDNRGRLTLAQAADGAVGRLADELQTALPNSLRLSSDASGVWIEWVPVLDAGRYRAAADTVAASPGDALDLEDATDNGFDVIGTPIAAAPAGSSLVIQNLGTPEADAYAGNNRRAGIVLSAGGRHLAFTPAGALPNSTATQRFFVAAAPVTLACVPAGDGSWELVRYSGYGWQAAQPAGPTNGAWTGATRTLMLGGLAGCSGSYSTALANIGLLNLRLKMGEASGGVKMDYLQQLAVDNTP
jgi:MSHA biogenesis protein MshO